MREPSRIRRPYPKNSGVVAASERMPWHLMTVPFLHRGARPKIELCERDQVNDRFRWLCDADEHSVNPAAYRALSMHLRSREMRANTASFCGVSRGSGGSVGGTAVVISEVPAGVAEFDIKIAYNWICGASFWCPRVHGVLNTNRGMLVGENIISLGLKGPSREQAVIFLSGVASV